MDSQKEEEEEERERERERTRGGRGGKTISLENIGRAL
jgi:hypothetical protein